MKGSWFMAGGLAWASTGGIGGARSGPQAGLAAMSLEPMNQQTSIIDELINLAIIS